jgi:hypothetical protein
MYTSYINLNILIKNHYITFINHSSYYIARFKEETAAPKPNIVPITHIIIVIDLIFRLSSWYLHLIYIAMGNKNYKIAPLSPPINDNRSAN